MNEIPDHAISPFRLTSLTLRGIGSYLHGTRLEIRPLTVLCGKNGSGKSTWIRALNILQKSLAKHVIPFELSNDQSTDYDTYDHTYSSYRVSDKPPISNGSPEDFGPVGTIGLHFNSVSDGYLPTSLDNCDQGDLPSTDLLAFLITGKYPSNTKFALYFTSPTHYDDWKGKIDLENGFRLCLGAQMIQFSCRPVNTRDWKILCSESFLTGNDYQAERAVDFLLCRRKSDNLMSQENASKYFVEALPNQENTEIREAIANLCIKRVCQLLEMILSGYFHIGAIRDIKTNDNASDSASDDEGADRRDRYVGKRGEYTHIVNASYSLNTMISSEVPYSGLIDNTYQPKKPREGEYLYKWLLLSDDQFLLNIREQVELSNAIADQISPADFADLVCTLFNKVLSRKDLYSPELWPEPGIEASFYLKKGIQNLAPADLIRLNRILLDQKVPQELTPGSSIYGLGEHYGFVFNVFYSKWLESLSEAKCFQTFETIPADFWMAPSSVVDSLPAGYLLSFEPHQRPVDETNDCEGIKAYRNPAFKEDLLASPANLSAGFHQIAPIIVQAGVMKKHELCSIENPEVHLHPNMQLKFTEFLISQAKIGKFFLIETHSDLVIRRIIRARLAEEYGEEMFRICFTSLKSDSPAKNAYSEAEKIDVNGRGQISNWPEGFLDDDLKESRELLDFIMYRGIGEATEESEDE